MTRRLVHLSNWIRDLFRRRRVDREIVAEVDTYVDLLAGEHEARGLSTGDARRAAVLSLGGRDAVVEAVREVRAGPNLWLNGLGQDIRYALRGFRRTPLMTATMVAVLSLGIGVNTALFSLVHSEITAIPNGVVRDDALVRIRTQARIHGPSVATSASYAEIEAYRQRRELFAEVAAKASRSVIVEDPAGNGPVSTVARIVTPNYFRLLGIRTEVGAGFDLTANEWDAAPPTALIGDRYWREVMKGVPDILGKTLTVNGAAVTIVGVLPPGIEERAVLWVPSSALLTLPGLGRPDRDSANFDQIIARLAPGASTASATPTAAAIGARYQTESWPRSADVVPFRANNWDPRNDREVYVMAAGFGAISILILLITCTNVTALVVGRALARRREVAVRISLGAPRQRIVRQVLAETVMLALLGGGLGVVILLLLLRLFGAVIDTSFPIHVEWESVLFTSLFAVGTGIVFGLSPALHASRTDVAEVLKDGGMTGASKRSRLQRAFVVAQVALTQPLLVGLMAMMVALVSVMSARRSRDVEDRVLMLSIDAMAGGRDAYDQASAAIANVRTYLATVPGIEMTALSSGGYSPGSVRMPPGERGAGEFADRSFRVELEYASPGYFALMDVPVVRGREFMDTERPRRDVEMSVMLGSDFAHDLWGSTDPIGKHLEFVYGIDKSTGKDRVQSLIVVGVVDANVAGPSTSEGRVRLYQPSVQSSSGLLIRTSGPAEAAMPLVRAAVKQIVPERPIRALHTLAQDRDRQRRELTQIGLAIAGGTLLALLLAAIGLYAVVAFAVGQRTREIGIRIALGARRGQIVRMFLSAGLRLCASGVFIGLPLSLVALSFIGRDIPAAATNKTGTGVAVVAVIALVAAAASWLPARRAAAVDPLKALRAE